MSLGTKLLWSGLTLMLAAPRFLDTLKLGGGEVFAVVGVVVMVAGIVVVWVRE